MDKYFVIKVLDSEVYYGCRRNGRFEDTVYLAAFFGSEEEAEKELTLIVDQANLWIIQSVYMSKQFFEQLIEQQKMFNQ